MNFNMLIEFLLCKGKQDVNYRYVIDSSSYVVTFFFFFS